MGGKYTEAQKKATAKYQKENTEMVSFRVPKGKKAEYKALADKTGKSLSSLIIDILEEKLKEEH